jgi:hypothetical protein
MGGRQIYRALCGSYILLFGFAVGSIRSYSISSNIATQSSPFGSTVRTLRRLSNATRKLGRRDLAAARSPGNGQVGRSDSEIGGANQAEWRGLVRSSK